MTQKTFVSADHHFGHINILTYTDRGKHFNDVQHMNEMLVKIHNDRVAPNDIVFFLGDVVMGSREDNLKYVARMNGYKFLIPGNHDNCHPMYAHKNKYNYSVDLYEKHFSFIINKVDDIMTEYHHWPMLTEDSMKPLHFCHFPRTGDSHDEERYKKWRPLDCGIPIVHGHTHNKDNWDKKNNQFHIGIDSELAEYGPIELETVRKIIYG